MASVGVRAGEMGCDCAPLGFFTLQTMKRRSLMCGLTVGAFVVLAFAMLRRRAKRELAISTKKALRGEPSCSSVSIAV